MTVDVTFDVQITHDEGDPDTWLDPGEREMLLDHTRHQLIRHVQQALKDMTCPEHGQPPAVAISGTFDSVTEQMDIQYQVHTCCNLFLMQCVAALNRR